MHFRENEKIKDIVPTHIEREISEWRHAVNHAEFIDEIPIRKQTFSETLRSFPNRNNRNSVETSLSTEFEKKFKKSKRNIGFF